MTEVCAQQGSMTRTVSAKTDVVGQSERATSGGCSATSPALTPASSVQGLSLLAAHPNRVVSPAPTVTGSSPSLTRPCSSQSPNSPNSRMNPKGKAVPPSVQPRRRSTNSRRSMGAAPNLDIQRVQGLSQVHPRNVAIGLSATMTSCLFGRKTTCKVSVLF